MVPSEAGHKIRKQPRLDLDPRSFERDHPSRPRVLTYKPMPSLADFHDQELRDRSVTWLALAECTKWEVLSITGHSLKSIDDILKHYFGMHPELARSAMAKMDGVRRRGKWSTSFKVPL
ncbi:hypothetical protein QEZ47_02475 [Aminobacter anthyllidis]|uniref:hypothetical protein n=1 Tax=Aminobacter anthyllidis TaxID=1035067 RepID=UPI0024568BA9|nr:hypothetical protein [Aminobacter anthyllidis]MDH4984442.1 hypothetical protein [Aminobacter anthyllidis]